MATSRMKISEQCLLWLNGGRLPDAANVHIYEIRELVNQIGNKLLKLQFVENMNLGENIPNGLAIAEYNNMPIVKYNNVSKSVLPAYPIKLPMNMGLYEIFATGDVTSTFIPLQQGDIAMLASMPLLNAIFPYTGYELRGMNVVYSKDLTNNGQSSPTVTIRLVVLDFSQYGDTDILPIDASQEYDIITEVCKFYGAEPPPDKIDDPGNSDQRTSQQMMG